MARRLTAAQRLEAAAPESDVVDALLHAAALGGWLAASNRASGQGLLPRAGLGANAPRRRMGSAGGCPKRRGPRAAERLTPGIATGRARRPFRNPITPTSPTSPGSTANRPGWRPHPVNGINDAANPPTVRGGRLPGRRGRFYEDRPGVHGPPVYRPRRVVLASRRSRVSERFTTSGLGGGGLASNGSSALGGGGWSLGGGGLSDVMEW